MWAYGFNTAQNEFYHHGIKGMHWGIRRFQNKDGSLTNAGRRRYDVDVDKAKERVASAKKRQQAAADAYNKATYGGLYYNKKATDNLVKAKGGVKYAKDQVRSEKIKERLNAETGNKSKHRLKLEEEYKAKGMSEEEAAIAAYKRARTEKIIGVTAGVAVAAAAAYVAYKHYDKTVDKYISAGTELQNISSNGNKGVADAFYFSMTKSDNTKYRGLYGRAIKYRGEQVYETKIGVKSAMKVASEKSATKALDDLVKNDSDFRETLFEHLSDSHGRYATPKQNELIDKAMTRLRAGKVDSKVYEALNLTLVDHKLPTSPKVNSTFYDKLKKMGYDAIEDLNDKKFSGYKSSKPMIAFNGAAKTAVSKVREVDIDEINTAVKKGMANIQVKSLAPAVAVGAGSIGLISASRKASAQKQRDAIVSQYKDEHPGTTLTYNQILDRYYGG